ncbi:MAG: DUF721 domain-containing protein [Sphaerochaetaceae bacterium]|jgi:predicted nucleic acid-binding Zn ribbon protein|nr:DUF721 domain-containing protein [Sphaerochaetaceae bacterium]MDD3941162.1 DUF721 domain-containing protein [Sphaerochaetaceae bacterium]MDX9938847.1 DUF721 domain-containing protein [Sphaerochaetaceae bacterium]
MKEKSTKELLDMLLSRLNIDEQGPLATVHREWMEIVGPDIAVHAKILDIRGKVLIIESDHPTWSSMIHMRKKQIIGRIARQFPELGISQIQVRVRKD